MLHVMDPAFDLIKLVYSYYDLAYMHLSLLPTARGPCRSLGHVAYLSCCVGKNLGYAI